MQSGTSAVHREASTDFSSAAEAASHHTNDELSDEDTALSNDVQGSISQLIGMFFPQLFQQNVEQVTLRLVF